MPPGEKSTDADDIAQVVHLFNKFEELPLAHTGCDSYASWHPAYKDLSVNYATADVVDKLLSTTPNNRWVQDNGNDVHLVITGGEPLLGWQRTYEELLSNPKMSDLKNITFETNGTQTLRSDFTEFLCNWRNNWDEGPKREITFSVSAKLSASGEKWKDAICPEIVSSYQAVGTTYLKFVVETEEHFTEVDKAVEEFRNGGFTGIVYVMPQGGIVAPYEQNRVRVADWALTKGYCYSPRLHVDLWGNGWGK